MKKYLLIAIIILNSSIISMAQKPIEFIKEIKQLPDGSFQIIEKNKEGDILLIGVLSSINPEIRNGVFYFYYSNGIIEAKGEYSGDLPSNIWKYYDKQGNIVKSIDYNKTIDFLNADTIEPKEVYTIVEQMPYLKTYNSETIKNKNFADSHALFNKYIQENLVYPIHAAKMDVSDFVYMNFVVDETGKICSVRVLQSSGNLDLNMEALRVISESPRWEPGRQRNNPVKVAFNMPIRFTSN